MAGKPHVWLHAGLWVSGHRSKICANHAASSIRGLSTQVRMCHTCRTTEA